jgi:hypothetical protein
MRKDINEYYRALGISPGADPAQIRRAYRQLVQQWHPDLFKPGSPMQTTAEDITKEINEAYEQLYRKGLHKKFRPVAATPARAAEAGEPGPGDSDERETEQARQSTRRGRTEKRRPKTPREREPKMDRAPKPKSTGGLSTPFWARTVLAAAGVIVAVAVAPKVWKAWMTPATQSASHPQADSTGVPPGAARAADPIPRPGAGAARPFPPPAAPTRESDRRSGRIRTVDLGPIPDYIVPFNGEQAANFGQSDAATLFRRAETLLDVFEVGDTKAKVRAIQGPPDDSAENVFRYGSSLVYFKEGVVKGWSIGLPRLRVHEWPSLDLSLLDTFSLGSSRGDVVRAQGDPASFTPLGYYYGTSAVYFESDRVSGWSQGDVALRELDVPLLPFFELDAAGPR